MKSNTWFIGISIHRMIREFENDCDKHRRAKEQIIITLVLITATVIGTISWVPQNFAYMPPNSSSSTNGVLGIPSMNTPASSVQCLPGYSPEYYSGYIAGFNDAIRSYHEIT